MQNTTKNSQIILGVCGSIAAYKSADIIRRLIDKNYDVSIVMTKDAEKFISSLTLGALAGKKVFKDLFDEQDNGTQMGHIQLAQKATAVVIAPATANIIGKLAHGLADDLLTCLCLVTRAPIILAPAMNDLMYSHPQVQANCRILKERGVHFIEPMEGKLACGSFGVGHLAEVDDIIAGVQKILTH